MSTQSTSSSQNLEKAKEKLSNALQRLNDLIDGQTSKVENVKILRTQVIKDLDTHIKNLELIINNNN